MMKQKNSSFWRRIGPVSTSAGRGGQERSGKFARLYAMFSLSHTLHLISFLPKPDNRPPYTRRTFKRPNDNLESADKMARKERLKALGGFDTATQDKASREAIKKGFIAEVTERIKQLQLLTEGGSERLEVPGTKGQFRKHVYVDTQTPEITGVLTLN